MIPNFQPTLMRLDLLRPLAIEQPQYWQNFASGATGEPHFGHVSTGIPPDDLSS